MKPGIVRAEGMGHEETKRIVRWMTINGLRHYVPEFAEIQVTGNHFTVETFDIERVGQKNKKWARRRFIKNSEGEIVGLPIKVRKYRIRVPLVAVK